MPLFPLKPLFFLVQNSFFILLCLKIMPNAMPCTSLYMGLALIAKGIAFFLLFMEGKAEKNMAFWQLFIFAGQAVQRVLKSPLQAGMN